MMGFAEVFDRERAAYAAAYRACRLVERVERRFRARSYIRDAIAAAAEAEL